MSRHGVSNRNLRMTCKEDVSAYPHSNKLPTTIATKTHYYNGQRINQISLTYVYDTVSMHVLFYNIDSRWAVSAYHESDLSRAHAEVQINKSGLSTLFNVSGKSVIPNTVIMLMDAIRKSVMHCLPQNIASLIAKKVELIVFDDDHRNPTRLNKVNVAEASNIYDSKRELILESMDELLSNPSRIFDFNMLDIDLREEARRSFQTYVSDVVDNTSTCRHTTRATKLAGLPFLSNDTRAPALTSTSRTLPTLPSRGSRGSRGSTKDAAW